MADDDAQPRSLPVREVVFAVALLVAAGLVVAGFALVQPAAALVAAGFLLAGWAWLVCGDVDKP